MFFKNWKLMIMIEFLGFMLFLFEKLKVEQCFNYIIIILWKLNRTIFDIIIKLFIIYLKNVAYIGWLNLI